MGAGPPNLEVQLPSNKKMRKTKFENDEYYHIYNRGVDKREIFSDRNDYIMLLESLNFFNDIETIGSIYELSFAKKKDDKNLGAGIPIGSPAPKSPLVEIIAYSLLPNHFHLLLKQNVENGISKFMHKIGGYTLFYNKKRKRSGALFQGSFCSVHIDSEHYRDYISGYINGNSEIHKIEKADEYTWSSYKDYLGKRNGELSKKQIILENFDTAEEYKAFVDEVIKNASNIKEDKKLYLLE